MRAAVGGHTQKRTTLSARHRQAMEERVSWCTAGPVPPPTARRGVRQSRPGARPPPRPRLPPSQAEGEPQAPGAGLWPPGDERAAGPHAAGSPGRTLKTAHAVGSGMCDSASQQHREEPRAHRLGAHTPMTSHITEAASWETPWLGSGAPGLLRGAAKGDAPSRPPSRSDDADVHHRASCSQTRP